MPEGDALHRAAQMLQPLVGQQVSVETPNPRAPRIADRLDGRRLEAVEARGKNLLLRFEGGLVLRSHLRMRGRWQVHPKAAKVRGQPWLVLHSTSHSAVLWNGPVLELSDRAVRRLGPDILADPPDYDRMLANLRATDQAREVGEALLDQRLVAGIGNLWRAEALWEARLSPWRRLRELQYKEVLGALEAAHALMSGGGQRKVYRRAGRPCPRCGERIRSRPQGDDARVAYWCPGCQEDAAA